MFPANIDDDEIRAVEDRIVRERHALVALAHDSTESARDRVASPSVLAILVGVGFLLGELTRARRNSAKPRKASGGSRFAGLLFTAAVSLIRAQYGSPLAFARMLLDKVRHRAPAWRAAAEARARTARTASSATSSSAAYEAAASDAAAGSATAEAAARRAASTSAVLTTPRAPASRGAAHAAP